jgi:hypothetical protein
MHLAREDPDGGRAAPLAQSSPRREREGGDREGKRSGGGGGGGLNAGPDPLELAD